MKILFLNHDLSPYTGAGRFFISLTSTLKHLIPGLSIKVATSEDIISPNKLKLLLNFPKVLKMARDCDVVHALDGWPYGFIGALCAKITSKKLIITAVGTGGVQPLYGGIKRRLLRWAYRRANRVVAVSRHTRDEILKVIPSLNIEVINHGVDSRKFQASGTGHQSLVSSDQRPVSSDQSLVASRYILSVGAWKKRKGLEYSIAAFDIVKKKFPDLHYAILSNPPEEIKQKYRQVDFFSGLSEEKLAGLYKNAELFILLPQDDNKDIEGFGLAYLEAAAAGLPVIGAKNTSAEDAVLDGKNGFLVNGQDSEEAAAAMAKILNSPELRSEMSRQSIEFAKTMTWEKAAQSYKILYENV